MDRGGVWNGTAEVTATTGDTLQVTACNTATGANTAFDLTASVVLPANFSYVAGTVNGIAGITASVAGQTVTFLPPIHTDISTGTCVTIGYGVVAGAAVLEGTYFPTYTLGWGSVVNGTDGTSGAVAQNILVNSGAATIQKTPSTQLHQVGDSSNWSLTVTNTGGGGMFGVSLDEVAINPGPSLTLTGISQSTPTAPVATLTGAKLTLPYLYPSQAFVASSTAVVTNCQNITNTAYVDDRTHVSSASAQASVSLDFRSPLIDFTVPPITLDNLTTVQITIPITNMGLGAAKSVVLATTLGTFPIVVSSVTAGWTYDAVSGSFTKTGGGGTIANGGSDTLQFNVAPAGGFVCTAPPGGTNFASARYTDVCGNPYVFPFHVASVGSNYTQPSLGLSKTMPGQIVSPASGVISTVTISIARPDLIATDPIVVVDTLPANVSAVVLGSPTGGSASCVGGCGPGKAVTWTIPKPSGSSTANFQLPITFAVPAVACTDNQSAVNIATTAAVDTQGCPLSAAANASSVLTNTVSTNVQTGYTQAYSISGGVHETGLPDDGNGVRDPGEGQFIVASATYSFPAGFTGSWSGSSFTDNFSGSAALTMVPNSLTVSWDGGAPVAVPGGSVLQTAGALKFSAAFLNGPSFLNSDAIAGHAVSFVYALTAADAALGAGNTATLSQFSDFEVTGASGACTGATTTRIIQFAADAIARGAETFALAIPQSVDVCQTFSATATVSGANFATFGTSATILTNSSYTYVTGQTPVYGGQLNLGNVTYAENGGVNPTFVFTGGGYPAGSGTIGFLLHRKANASTNNSAIAGTSAYDDWQTDPGALRAFSNSGNAAPLLTQSGRLILTTTPQTVSVTGSQVSWIIYVNNADSGGLYNLSVKDVLPAGLTLNSALTNAQNPSYPVSLSGSTATWSTSGGQPITIPAGGGIALTVVADVNGLSCSVPVNTITGTWGCDGVAQETVTHNDPALTFPGAGLQAVHDSVNTFTQLCAPSIDSIIVRNTGLVHLFNATAQEVLNPAVTGIDIVPGSVQVSTDNLLWTSLGAGGDPSGLGTTGSPYAWTSAQVPQLADISPLGAAGYPTVRIRFQVTANELTNGLAPQVTTLAGATTACGAPVSDPGTPFNISVQKPQITVTKLGKNLTAGQPSFTSTVFGGQGDVIQWLVTVTNNGAAAASHLRLVELLPSDSGAATVSGAGITGSPAVTSGLAVRVSTLAASGASAGYTVTETLGGTCVSDVNTANFSWGCAENTDGLRSNLNSPAASTATAGLVMSPIFNNATSTVTFTALPGGRAEVVAHFFNSGGSAQGLVVLSTIPAGFTLDATSTPSFTTDGTGFPGAMTALGSLTSPKYAFPGGLLRNGNSLDLHYRVIQTGAFDTAFSSFTSPETVGAGTDPAPPAGGAVPVEIDFQSTCAGASTQTITGSLNPPTPDVDLSVNPSQQALADGAIQSFVYTVTNSGLTGSVADHVSFSLPTVGPGWTINSVTVNTPGTGGAGGACAAVSPFACTEAQLGTLAVAQNAVITVNATIHDNGGALDLVGQTQEVLYTDNGTSTGNDLGLDQAAPRVVGVNMSLSLLSTSESFTSTTTLAIGEEATFRLTARWFGGVDIGTITVRDTLPAGLGFVAFSTAAANTVAIPSQGGAAPVTAGQVNFGVPTFTGPGNFVVDLVARALNAGGNTNGHVLTDNLGLKFDALGVTYASNSGSDGFGGTQAALHASTNTVIGRPALTFTKQVQNATTGGGFAATVKGNGGDSLNYRLTVTNTGGAPALDVTVADLVKSAKIVLIDGSATAGTFDVPAGSVTYDAGNTATLLPTPGQNLAELDPGQTVQLNYSATIAAAATPNDALSNGATFYASSLNNPSGNETAFAGAPGSGTGELLLTGFQSSNVTISTIGFTKALTATSIGGVSTNVVVGEQLQFALSLVMPAGTTPGLNVYDLLPTGMSLVATPATTFGSALTASQPTITPGALPANGPATIDWNFGTVVSGVDPVAANRTITIAYTVQVRNAAGVVDGFTMVNGSSYTYTGSPPVNGSTVTVAVIEPVHSPATPVSIAFSPSAGIAAGTVVIATVTVNNSTGHSGARDLEIVAFLPSGFAYVPSSTLGISGSPVGEPDIAGSTLTWGRTQAAPQQLDVTTSTVFSFHIQLLATSAVLPAQQLPVTVLGDWNSLTGNPGPNLGVALGGSGSASGRRTGIGGAPDTYLAVASASATVANVYTVVKSSAPGPLPDASYRVGDLVSYSINAVFQPGTVDDYRIEDALPPGLAFDNFTPVTPASGVASIAYLLPSGSSAPVNGATGTLSWYFGRVTNSGAGPGTLTLAYQARVLDDLPNTPKSPSRATKVNAARARYDNALGAPLTTAVSGSTITVSQPVLTSGKVLSAGQTVVTAGALVHYRATVISGGAGPAYDIQVQDTLPVGMQAAAPTVTSATLNGVGVTLSQSYAAPLVTWTLSDAQVLNASVAGSTNALVIAYDATVDAVEGGGLSLTNSALVTQSFSKDGTDTTQRRNYGVTPSSSATVTTPSPAGIAKTVSLSSAAIGASPVYTITAPTATVGVPLYNVHVLDTIPAGMTFDSRGTNAGSLSGGGCAAVNITDNSNLGANTLDILYSCLPAGTQAVVTATTTVKNVAGNVKGTVISNSASFAWAQTQAGVDGAAISTSGIATTVVEPTLTITKSVVSVTTASAVEGLQGGDAVRYRIKVLAAAGTNTSPAANIVIVDVADQNLLTPVVTPNPDAPGAPSPGATSGGVTPWTWSLPGTLAPGATYQFDVEFTLGPGVQPMQTLVNTSSVTWKSLPGVPSPRDGTGGINNYLANSAPVSVVVGPVHMEKAVKSPGGSNYAVGSTVTYRLDFTFGQGTVNGVHALDLLPTGLVFSTATVITNAAQKSGGGLVAFLSGPAPGAVGTLDFSLGAVESTGTAPAVLVDVVARVQNVGGNVNGTVLTNGVQSQLLSSTGGVVGVGPVNPLPQITVVEPKLALAFDAPPGGTMDFGTTSTFTVRGKNTGTATAFQPTLSVLLAPGLRANSPALLPLVVSISGGRSLTLAAGPDYTVSYSSTTGLLTTVLISSSAFAAVGETLTEAFQARLDNDPSSGAVLLSSAAATQFFSVDVSGGIGPDVRTYTNPLGSSNNTADNAAILAADGPGDNAPVTVRAPLLSVTKSVNPFNAFLPQDKSLTWSVLIANGGQVAAPATVLSDDLGAWGAGVAFISSGTLSSATVSGAPGGWIDGSAPLGGTSSKGLVSVTNLTIPALSTVTVSFSIGISSSIPNLTKILNRASFTAPGFSGVFQSTSNRADPGGITAATINSTPGFDFLKSAAVVGGGSLLPGSTIAYTLTVRNRGTERSLNSAIVDSVPGNTAYIPGSTALNAVPVADASGGASPLAAGLSINTPGEAAGALAVYTGTEQAIVTFSVRVATGTPAGSAISNQGFLSGQGEGTGTPISKPSDDPSTLPSPDPTVLVVSGGAFLVSEKTSSIDVGTVLVVGSTLTYTVTVRNLGDQAATAVVLKDAIPPHLTYIPGTLSYGVSGSSSIVLAAMTDAADADAADYNVGTTSVTVNIGTMTASGQARVSFKAVVAVGTANGTVLANQAAITAAHLTTVHSDGDGNHGNGDQPVYNVVGAGTAAVLQQTKQVFAVAGGAVNPGDQLQYLITTLNVGNSTATNVTITDPAPAANAAYSTGTTTLDGVPVADVGLISPLVAGYNIGSVNPGQSRIVIYRVRVSSSAAAGAIVDNQATFSGNGGTLTGSSCSDRPDCITRVEVGGTPGSASVSGRVWQDLNHDRVYQAGAEPIQPGWTVEVVLGGTVVASQTTGADGTYRLVNLTPGAGYQIRFRNPLSGAVYGKAISSEPGTVLTDGTIRSLSLQSGDNILNQSLPLDPNGVLYDSITRQPIAGAQVFLDGPALFDPTTQLLPGQNGQVTGNDGLYRFDINFGAGAPLGVYTLRFAAPGGYLTNLPALPSTIVPPSAATGACAQANCLDVPVGPPDPFLVQAQNTAPTGVQPTPYYLRFQFNAGSAGVVNNHVPLDPILNNAIFVTKTALTVDVSRGDLVAYVITARNNYASALPNIALHDLIPPGFKYRSGSATLNGAALPPAVSGRALEWTGLTFAPNETKTFKLLLIVGSGVGYGKYVNEAWALNTIVHATVSNVASVAVQVTPDPTFDCSDVLGKVFDDSDANGYEEKGERGLANVRVATVNGWLVDTDAQGRFHIVCAEAPNEDRGSNFVMKVDEQTLPTGYRMTTENPRSIRLTSGKFAKIEFGAALYRVARLDLSSAAFVAPPAAEEYWGLSVDTAAIPSLRFAVAKSTISDEQLEVIRQALDRVRALPDARHVSLKVVGHTDWTPISGKLALSIPDNWALSRSRAETAAALIREKLNLPADLVAASGRAATEPVAPNDTAEGRALNRRVEIQIAYERKVYLHGENAHDGRLPWQKALDRLMVELPAHPTVVRVGYCRGLDEKIEAARFRVWQISTELKRRWAASPGHYALIVEQELDGASCAGGGPP